MQRLVWERLQQLCSLQPKGGNTPDICQLTDGQTDWSMLTAACYSPVERNKVLTRAAMWVSLQNTMVTKDGRHEGHILQDSFHVTYSE